MAEPGTVSALADDYIERSCALDPIRATGLGVPGHDDQLTDYSPSGVEDRIALDRDTLVQLASIEARTDDERRSAIVHDRAPGRVTGDGRRQRAPAGRSATSPARCNPFDRCST